MSHEANRNTLVRVFWAVWEKAWWIIAIIFLGGFIYLAVMDTDLFIRIFSLIFLIVGIATLLYVERMRRQQKESLSWRPAPSRILSSEVKKEVLRSGRGPGTSIST
jgi:hypothetical protein